MFGSRKTHHQVVTAVVEATPNSAAGSNGTSCPTAHPPGPSRLRLKIIERIAIVRFADSEFLLGDTTAQEVIGQLGHLVEAEGHSRLLLNLGGVGGCRVKCSRRWSAFSERWVAAVAASSSVISTRWYATCSGPAIWIKSSTPAPTRRRRWAS